jgi:hypothetical protein
MVLPISAAKSRLGDLQYALTSCACCPSMTQTSMIKVEPWMPLGFELDVAPPCYFGLIPNA